MNRDGRDRERRSKSPTTTPALANDTCALPSHAIQEAEAYSGLVAAAGTAVRSATARVTGLSSAAADFLAEVAPNHLAAVASCAISTASDAGAAAHARAHYYFQESAFKSFTRFFQQGSLAHVPSLKRMCLDLRVSATLADKADAARAVDAKGGGGGSNSARRKRKIAALSRIKGTHLQTCEIQLKKAFSLAINDKLNDISQSRKWGALFVINQLLKIYFRLNLLLLCKTLVQAVDSRAFPPLDRFPSGQRVAYLYYVGRLSMFEDNYKRAETQVRSCPCPPLLLLSLSLLGLSLSPFSLSLSLLGLSLSPLSLSLYLSICVCVCSYLLRSHCATPPPPPKAGLRKTKRRARGIGAAFSCISFP